MIERRSGVITFICDECDERGQSERYPKQFKEAWQDMKDQGWQAYNDVEKGWTHNCPACRT
jgi:hypothetical protein